MFETDNGFVENQVHQPLSETKGLFVCQLSLKITPTEDTKTSQPFYETSVPGVFAVGECATVMKSVSQTVAMGVLAAAGMVYQLGAELAGV